MIEAHDNQAVYASVGVVLLCSNNYLGRLDSLKEVNRCTLASEACEIVIRSKRVKYAGSLNFLYEMLTN